MVFKNFWIIGIKAKCAQGYPVYLLGILMNIYYTRCI